jgi:hypothetical protein
MENTASDALILGNLVRVTRGNIEIKFKISKHNNYHRSSGVYHFHKEKVADVVPFLLGLTVIPTGVDGCSDGEVDIYIESRDQPHGEWKWTLIKIDPHLPDIQDPYVIWTNDGQYDSEELSTLQGLMGTESCKLTLQDLGCIILGEKRLGMSIDMFDTVFADTLPAAFLRGLKCFEDEAKSGELRLINLGKSDREDANDSSDEDSKMSDLQEDSDLND